MLSTLLVDTNLLIRTVKHLRIVGPYLKRLTDKGYEFAYTELTQMEFLRGARTEQEYDEFCQTLADLGILLPDKSETIDVAVQIGRIYQRNHVNPKQISIGDLTQAAHLAIYSTKLKIATTDLQDFPPTIFRCIDLDYLVIEKRYEIIGIFEIDHDKYQAEVAKLKQSN